MVVNPTALRSVLGTGLRTINTVSTASSMAGAAEAALHGDYSSAVMMLGGAALGRLRGSGTSSMASSQLAGWGIRGLGAVGMGQGVVSAYNRFQSGDMSR